MRDQTPIRLLVLYCAQTFSTCVFYILYTVSQHYIKHDLGLIWSHSNTRLHKLGKTNTQFGWHFYILFTGTVKCLKKMAFSLKSGNWFLTPIWDMFYLIFKKKIMFILSMHLSSQTDKDKMWLRLRKFWPDSKITNQMCECCSSIWPWP